MMATLIEFDGMRGESDAENRRKSPTNARIVSCSPTCRLLCMARLLTMLASHDRRMVGRLQRERNFTTVPMAVKGEAGGLIRYINTKQENLAVHASNNNNYNNNTNNKQIEILFVFGLCASMLMI